MRYYSLNRKSPSVTFREAVIRGIAPDRGLYFPETIRALPKGFFTKVEDLDKSELALALISQFVGDEIPQQELFELIKDVLSVDFPVIVSVTLIMTVFYIFINLLLDIIQAMVDPRVTLQ